MNILIDECLPRKLKFHFKGHSAKTVLVAGWAGKDNGEPLYLAEKEFDIFITIDQNIAFQQNIQAHNIGLIVLALPSNRFGAIIPYISAIKDAINKIKPGQLIKIKN
ncbi:MAG: hypothetical protein ACE5GL_10295 [Calditrichia bacterium]